MDSLITNAATKEERQRDMQAVLTLMKLSEIDHRMLQERTTLQRQSAAAEGMAMMSRAAVASLGALPDGSGPVVPGNVRTRVDSRDEASSRTLSNDSEATLTDDSDATISVGEDECPPTGARTKQRALPKRSSTASATSRSRSVDIAIHSRSGGQPVARSSLHTNGAIDSHARFNNRATVDPSRYTNGVAAPSTSGMGSRNANRPLTSSLGRKPQLSQRQQEILNLEVLCDSEDDGELNQQSQ